MEIPFFMKFLEPNDHFCQNFRSFFNSENFSRKLRLIVDKITAIAVLENEVDVGLVFFDVIKLGDIR